MRRILRATVRGAVALFGIGGAYMALLVALPPESHIKRMLADLLLVFLKPIEWVAGIFLPYNNKQDPIFALVVACIYFLVLGAFLGAIISSIQAIRSRVVSTKHQ